MSIFKTPELKLIKTKIIGKYLYDPKTLNIIYVENFIHKKSNFEFIAANVYDSKNTNNNKIHITGNIFQKYRLPDETTISQINQKIQSYQQIRNEFPKDLLWPDIIKKLNEALINMENAMELNKQ